jgi:hypothetical protein
MQNPFLKPHTVPQWLLSSICWVGTCLGGFLLCSKGAFSLHSNENFILSLVFGSAIIVCVLMWRQVISTGWQIVGKTKGETFAVKLVAYLSELWFALVVAAFFISVGLIAFGMLICLALSGESQGGGWQ